MILQTLRSYYDRLKQNPEIEISEPGYAPQRVHFAVVLSPSGDVVTIDDLRTQDGKKPKPRRMLLPSIEKTSGIRPQFLWDNTQYVLGRVSPDEPQKKQSRALKAFEAFRQHHLDLLSESQSPSFQALVRFLTNWNPEEAEQLDQWEEMIQENGPNLIFRIDGELEFLHESAEAKSIWKANCQSESDDRGFCLVEGVPTELARLHPGIKGVDGAQAKGAAIVSFNCSAFTSYGKEQSFNAPTGVETAFAYTTALNHLLRRENNHQRIKIGDTTTIFWAERESPMESWFGMMVDPDSAAEADQAKIRDFLNNLRKGRPAGEIDFDDDVRFYILGLSPNNSRLAVRFWCPSTVGAIAKNIGQHFHDLEIELGNHDKPFPSLYRILIQTARESKDISPLLAGQLARSIFTGLRYPDALLSRIISRIRADQQINAVRAAAIKAILNRNARISNREEYITVTLDKTCTDAAYLLGRLFAVLEKLQRDAQPGINTTIKDRFFSSASKTPAGVFPRLLHLSQHHLGKIDNPAWKVHTEKLIAEIMDGFQELHFPAHLKLEDQGQFVIGYYHQMRALYTKKEVPSEEKSATSKSE